MRWSQWISGGQVLDEVEALGIGEDTVLFFGSDNGREFRRFPTARRTITCR